MTNENYGHSADQSYSQFINQHFSTSAFFRLPLHHPSPRNPDFPLPLAHRSPAAAGGNRAAVGRVGHCPDRPVGGVAARELSSRFGPMLLMRLDQAFGRLPEPVPVCPTAPTFAADWSAEYPTSRRETICAALGAFNSSGSSHARPLRPRASCDWNVGWIARVPTNRIADLQSFFVGGAVSAHGRRGTSLPVGSAPVGAAAHPAPVTGVHVAATLTAPLERPRQAMLFDFGDDDQHTPRTPFAALVERLSSRLGRQSVAGVRLRPEAQPELSWHYDPLVEHRRRRHAPKALPHELPPRPLRLLPRPRLLVAMSIVPDGPPLKFHDAGQEQHIVQSWGPERIETGWWRGRPVGRDYFRVETAAGCRFWLFRRLRDGKWFLHGSFD